MVKKRIRTAKLNILLAKALVKDFAAFLNPDHPLTEVPLSQTIGNTSALYV